MSINRKSKRRVKRASKHAESHRTPPDTPPAPPAGISTVKTVTAPSSASEIELHSKGQRFVNKIWEVTQAAAAIMVTIAMIYCSIMGLTVPALDNAFTLIIAVYFVRMNHTKVGGVGGTDTR